MKKSKKPSIVFVILSALVLAYYLSRGDEVVNTDPNWSCEFINNEWRCTVSFEISNLTYDRQTRKLSIRGIRIPADSKYSSLKIYGEKMVVIDLAPLEILKIHETIKMARKPNEIKVKIWK